MKTKHLTITLVALAVFALLLTAVLPFICTNQSQQIEQASAAADWTPTYSGNYYNEIDESQSGQALRDSLASLITKTHHTETTYAGLKTIFNTTDRNPNGSGILLFYTGTQVESYSAAGANREHVWAKRAGAAFSPEESKCGSDAHHLRPTDTQLNSTRSNYPFDEVTASSPAKGDSNNGTNPCYLSGGYFYPGKGYRGATARILFYVQTRWGSEYSLFLADDNLGNKGQGKLSTLMKWHLEEPPTAAEILRNEEVYKIQGNRNPFIDHPEYAAMIYCHTNGLNSIDGTALGNKLVKVVSDHGGNYNDTPIDVESVSFDASNYNLIVGNSLSLASKVTVAPSNANQSVTFTSSNSNVARIDGDRVVATGAGVATVTAKSVKDQTKTATATITVKAPDRLEISGNPNKTVYNVGERFDPTGITVKLYYSDDSSDDLVNTQCSWLDAVTNAVTLSGGTTAVICKYGNLQTTVSGITVKYMTGISVTGTPNKTIYEAGDRFNPEGLTVTASFSDGSTSQINVADCSWVDGVTGAATLSKGTTSVTCKYGQLSATFNGIVIKEILRISVEGTPKVTQYSAGQRFNPEGLTVTAYFNDETSQVVDNSACQWLDLVTNSAVINNNTQTIYCKYGSVSCPESERISIFVKHATGIRIVGTPLKTEYIYGEKFDPAGLTVLQVFNDGQESPVLISDCQFVDEYDSEVLSIVAQTVTCKFYDFQAQINAEILVKEIVGISVSGSLQKAAYEAGQEFDPSGLVVTLLCDNNGSAETVTVDKCEWVDNNGSHSVTSQTLYFVARYSYNGKTFTSNEIEISVLLSQNANVFITKVNHIAEINNHKEKLDAIKSALEVYATLSDSEKSDVSVSYKKLGDLITEYNQYSDTQNDSLANAVATAAIAASQAAVALLAALYIVGKKSK